MKRAVFVILGFLACFSASIMAQEAKKYLPEVHGTIRAKYEYEPTIGKGRFEIRNARIGEGPLQADIRLNYELYFYNKGVEPSISEQNKIVLEFVAHF